MDSSLIFASIGFVCFVGSVLFYFHSENKAMRAEWKALQAQKAEIFQTKKDIKDQISRIDFLYQDRNKNQSLIGEMQKQVELLHDHYSTVMTLSRESEIRRAETERQVRELKPLFPGKVEIVLIDKPKQVVSKSNPKGELNESKNKARKENKKPSRSSGPSLGRSYREVERANSR